MNYSQFEEEFKNYYSIKSKNIRFDDIHYAFLQEWNQTKCPFPLKLVDEDIEPQYNSYGDEESYLYRTFHHTEGDFYVQFEGTRNSYSGEEWIRMYEVKPSQRILSYYEVIKK